MTSSHYNATRHSVTPTSSSSTPPPHPVATITPHGPCNCTAEGSGFSTVTTTSTLPGTLTRTNATVSVNGTLYPTGGAAWRRSPPPRRRTRTGTPPSGAGVAAPATEATQNAASSLVAAVVGKLLGAVAVGMIVAAVIPTSSLPRRLTRFGGSTLHSSSFFWSLRLSFTPPL